MEVVPLVSLRHWLQSGTRRLRTVLTIGGRARIPTMSVKICLAAFLCVLIGVASADEFKHSGVADLSSDFAETTADGKLYFVKVRTCYYACSRLTEFVRWHDGPAPTVCTRAPGGEAHAGPDLPSFVRSSMRHGAVTAR